jgi:hypothetical protein
MDLSPEQGVRLRRAASRYLKSMRKKKPRHKNRAPGMWWLSSSPATWLKLPQAIQITLAKPAVSQ